MVLKVDQPTGREVQGFVAEVLTSGDHPRGIKVRLRDGRVGRVQIMTTEEAATAGSEGSGNLGRNGEPASGSGIHTEHRPSGRRINMRYTDIRRDDELEEPSTLNGLDAYIVPSRQQRKQKSKSSHVTSREDAPPVASTTSICPVCRNFEGEETAVAQHVEEHFARE